MGSGAGGVLERGIIVAAWLMVVALAIYHAAPRGRWHRRRIRCRVLARALLPTRLLRSPSGRLDIAFMLFGVLFAGAAIGWALFSSLWFETALYGALLAHGLKPPPAAGLPPMLCTGIATVALYLAYEFAYWLNHLLSHRVRWLWEFHKVHHTAESLSPLTNFRVHPVDTIVFYNMVAAITGATAALLDLALGHHVAPFLAGGANVLIFVTSTIVSNLQHSHLWIALPGRWGRLLLGPAHHQLHHSMDPRHHGCNLGASLAIFDRLFGTLCLPEARRQPLRFGVAEAGHDPHGPFGAAIEPFVAAGGHLRPAWSNPLSGISSTRA